MNNYENILKRVSYEMTSIKKGNMEESCPIGIIDFENWEWPQGVGMYGLYKYYEATKDEKCLQDMIKWYDNRIADGLPDKNVNTMAPMLTLAYIYEITGRDSYLHLCKEWAQWVMTKMPRTIEGGLQHIVTGETNEQQMWDDTLFMTVLFLAKIGTILNEKSYIEESVYQFLLHIKYLNDPSTGLWYHGWSFIEKNHFAGALWARGNCWYTAGVVDYLEMIELDPSVKRYLVSALEMQVKTLGELQNKNGMWHTLLDDDTSYVETSATAGFGYGILKAVRTGLIDSKYRAIGEKALEAVVQRIDEKGIVAEVSYGTGMGRNLDFYRNIEICPMTYGQALVILILNEGILLSAK